MSLWMNVSRPSILFRVGNVIKVIYGFTRSNTHGKVGFLKELRRLNVAITRVQQNLVIIGNFTALARADDLPFRTVVADLRDYGEQYGEFLSYTSALQHIQSIKAEGQKR